MEETRKRSDKTCPNGFEVRGNGEDDFGYVNITVCCVDHETSAHLKLRFDGSKHRNKSLLGSRLPDDEEDQVPHVALALWTDVPVFPEWFMASGVGRII